MGINNDAAIPLPCPGCREKTEKTVAWFKTKPDSFECSGCGKTVHLNAEDINGVLAAFDDVDQSIQRFLRAFGGKGKRP